MTTTEHKEQLKCKYYNKGYCKNRSECKFYHPTSDCKEQFENRKCKFRHRNICRYKQYCYHYMKGQCEYIHAPMDLFDVPMAIDDKVKSDSSWQHRVSTIKINTKKKIKI